MKLAKAKDEARVDLLVVPFVCGFVEANRLYNFSRWFAH